jgi:osmotically-inducible protein OsmY
MTRLSVRQAAIIGVLASTTALSGCAALLVGGAVVGGSLVAADRRSSGAQIDDRSIELRSGTRVRDVLGDRGHVNVTSYNRLVLLTGEVPSEADRANVEQAVARVDNVKSVVNELAVMTATSLSQRSNDALVTTKVKATLVDAGDISSTAFKVFTERGIVYLMGRVTEREAERASDLARSISGVQKVVKVLEIVTDAELAEIDPKAVPKSAAAR